MDALFHEWNSEMGVEIPLPNQRKSIGLENELIELLWQNGEVVLQSQTNRKQNHDPSKTGPTGENLSSSLIKHHENLVGSWMDCPIDESFEKEFCAHILPEIQPIQKGIPDFPSLLSPRPCFGSFDVEKASNVVERQAFSAVGRDINGAVECSAKTIGSSNQVANEICARKVPPPCESVEMGMLDRVITSSNRDSDTTCWKTGSQSTDTSRQKRKSRDIVESECRSDATELESGSGNKSLSQKSRRARVAEVHNLSERRRRDRINEKMRALQELIPHSNKSDKASMLDEAIEYMKSLQLQLQLLWMASGMAPMMLPGMQPYMSHMGIRLGPSMLPAIQNLVRLPRLPLGDPAMTMSPSSNQTTLSHNAMLNSINYQNQMQNLSFPDQYANYLGFQSMQNAFQPNMFNYGSHLVQQNQTMAPQPASNGSDG